MRIHVALDHLISHVRFEPFVFLRACVCYRSLCEPAKSDRKKQFYPATDRQLNRLAQNSKSENFFEKQWRGFGLSFTLPNEFPKRSVGYNSILQVISRIPSKKIHALHKFPLHIVRYLIERISKSARSSRNDWFISFSFNRFTAHHYRLLVASQCRRFPRENDIGNHFRSDNWCWENSVMAFAPET